MKYVIYEIEKLAGMPQAIIFSPEIEHKDILKMLPSSAKVVSAGLIQIKDKEMLVVLGSYSLNLPYDSERQSKDEMMLKFCLAQTLL